jgi:hypothetical protein
MRRKIWCDGWKRKYFGLGWGSEQGLGICLGAALGQSVWHAGSLAKTARSRNRHCAKRTHTTSSENSMLTSCTWLSREAQPARTMVNAGMSELPTFCICTNAALTDFYLLVCDSNALVGKYGACASLCTPSVALIVQLWETCRSNCVHFDQIYSKKY